MRTHIATRAAGLLAAVAAGALLAGCASTDTITQSRMATERAGTTVEIACLYTICVTVFLSSTTYWSNDSIWPCSLMPFTR